MIPTMRLLANEGEEGESLNPRLSILDPAIRTSQPRSQPEEPAAPVGLGLHCDDIAKRGGATTGL